ncbi:hypothetical protein [Anaeromyxobacter oryzae]|uniref:VWFA domain-containing protein n=1 Tax=Anaeromyxobacter oryzae TaxID=2918170 RepID=A0ABN6MXB2_9BACT|nr:hypothetical protein [Anaeromyxobacter oryzae]BDG05221.1 hypothetical protein AMOR_42170 [Anaeromyxobacter oryzae]
MTRRLIALALLAAAVACNDYTFSPVGRCLVQPGSVRVQLSKVSTADILFVVDDSPSMDPKQQGLADSFKDFIDRMVATNTARAAKGLEPVDFHVAVTTSSIFYAAAGTRSCVAGTGGNQCCATSACTDVAACTPGTGGGCGAGQTCVTTSVLDASGNAVLDAKAQCCSTSACAPATTACVPGDACPLMTTAYANPLPSSSFCTPGLAVAGAPYPAGAFVAASGNPTILDFGKTLDWASWGTATQDPALTALVGQFTQNIRVGSCGSGEEQHLEAARLALQKALAGQQPGVAAGTWPHPDAKLVVVWVGDEDDCSSPASAPLAMAGSTPGADSCVLDKRRPAAAQREIPVSTYADFFAGLVKPGGAADLGAAFIVSSARCADGSYQPADSCTGTASCPVQPPATCHAGPVCGGAYAAGERFLALADAFKARGFGVVEGTVCDAYPPSSFGPVLSAIADLARPLDALRLPTRPGTRDLTQLRIVDASGATRRTCTPGAEWCFVDCNDASASPACLVSGTSECIAIDQTKGGCFANPGETYSAEYLGMLPPSGCASAAECATALGGKAGDWSCSIDAGQARGTCACNGG